MARFACFPTLHVARRKKSKDCPKSMDAKKDNRNGPFIYSSIGKDSSFNDSGKRSSSKEKLVMDENLVRAKAEAETAYQGSDERDDILSMNRDYSDIELRALEGAHEDQGNVGLENKTGRGEEAMTSELAMQSRHVSDPGMGWMTSFLGSPMLKRSCSNIETKRASQLSLSPMKSHSYNGLQNLLEDVREDLLNWFPGSPLSVVSKCSADKVMLKKRSSCQVLPSRSQKLWWKLFLWSHSNLRKPGVSRPQEVFSTIVGSNKKGGYSSDIIDQKSSKEKVAEEPENESRTDLWQHNQWIAFSAGSLSFHRVNAWVNSLDDSLFCPVDPVDEYHDGGEARGVVFLNTEIKESLGKNHLHASQRVLEEVVQANNVIQSLNPFSTMAHVCGMGLKVIPSVLAFSSLRAVNLSSNFIVHITPGSLPKSLHVLDLSRNKITTIEGLRDLTRLRVLNLSYNRISRINHGLSNCTLIKELYLAGNKISTVEGLHRLLKLSVLDLSFNKFTTTKSLGQLVPNYHSLQALNLLGNPIQSNIGDEQLRKAVCSLLPNLVYLNKQIIKAQRMREMATNSVAKAALGKSGWSSKRGLLRRVNQGPSTSVHRGASNSVNVQRSSRHRLKSKHRHSSTIKK